MARKQRSILIGCPHYQKLVPGNYDCDDAGNYLLGPDESFLLQRVHCSHYGGRCIQKLCVLHRHNQPGGNSWYPSRIVANPNRKEVVRDKKSTTPSNPPLHNGDMDILC